MKDQIDTLGLAKNFSGMLLKPGDEGYERARKVWNGMVDRRPALIARCMDRLDVISALQFARANNLEIGVRCGGHSVLGHAVPEAGLMVDLSLMNTVRVDPETRRARVQGGALLGALDREAQKYGLATTAGNVSHTGVGGLTLAGGMGWLARQFGMACDNVVSFELVTSAGEVLHASEDENPELYWGLRGGGGNFGIVTEFEFRLHPMSGQALLVDLFFRLDAAQQMLCQWRDLAKTAPREATLTAWTGIAGESLFMPSELNGQPIASIGYVWVGDPVQGRKFLPTLQGSSRPVAHRILEMTYVELQRIDDTTVEQQGLRRYWKGHYFNELPDEAIRAFLTCGLNDQAGKDDWGHMAGASMQSYGGAIADVPDDATAFSHRDALVECVISARWQDPAEDEKRKQMARGYAGLLEPFASGGYVHAVADEGQAGTQRAYSEEKLRRLTALKDKYDPENVFHRNTNVQPSHASGTDI